MAVGVGDRLGRYEILAPLAEGGMARVFRARDVELDREVAIKVLRERRHPERTDRFEEEARATAALTHPNVVMLHDVGRQGDARYLVTELLDGQTLRERLEHGGPAVQEAWALGRQIARALAAAHRRGITHGDLKPENLFVTASGVVKVLDFGLSHDDGALPRFSPSTGTAGYMAPEQIRGDRADRRSDVFALGAVLFELFTGVRAFPGATELDRAAATLHAPPLLYAAGHVPGWLRALIARCLQPAPEDRYASAEEVAEALEAGRWTPPLRGLAIFLVGALSGALLQWAHQLARSTVGRETDETYGAVSD